MPCLLRIDSSARRDGSVSRDLGDAFEAAWLERGLNFTVVRRDLADSVVPQIAQATIAAFYAPPGAMTDDLRAASALSDTLIAELKSADELLITVPMYNFTVPSALKAWIDQVVRINHTFAFDGTGFKGLLTARRATMISAHGAAGYLGGAFAAADFCNPYLKFLLSFLGITTVEHIGVEGTTGDAVVLAKQIADADVRVALTAVQ
jgi:FMN-dependent NADH-azoreductase